MRLKFETKLYILWIIFESLMIVSLLLTRDLALKILLVNESLNVYYWLSPEFAVIQAGNLIIAWGGIISGIMGSIIPANMYKKPLRTVLYIITCNSTFFITSIIITYIFGSYYFPSQGEFTTEIAYHSFLMFMGLKITINNSIIASILCSFDQIIEHYHIYLLKPQLGLYLPYSLSREIVTKNFPFWDYSSWASVNNTVAFASTSIIRDSHLQRINVSSLWIFSLLAGYLLLIYLKPYLKFINTREIKEREIIGNDIT